MIRKPGVQRTTVDKLTKECGIAKGSFYLFFTSKEDYLVELEKYTGMKLEALQQPAIEQCLRLISDARPDVDSGTVVNLIKCIYAMREHRDTMVTASIDDSIDVILRTLVSCVTGKCTL